MQVLCLGLLLLYFGLLLLYSYVTMGQYIVFMNPSYDGSMEPWIHGSNTGAGTGATGPLGNWAHGP